MKLPMFYVTVILLAWSSCVSGVNVALYKPATQTSTMFAYSTADKAVDGNTNKNFNSGTCMHTTCNDFSPSWTVNLGASYDITSVTIANPIQANNRMKNIKIEVFAVDPSTPGAIGVTCATVGPSARPNGIDITFPCIATRTGQYVKIRKTAITGGSNGYCDSLVFCEALVEGTRTPTPTPPPPAVCGTGFTAFQSTCFHVSSDFGGDKLKVTWYNAREACRAIGADLAILDNIAETNFVKTMLDPAANINYWIGGNELLDGVNWKWLDPAANAIIPPGSPLPGFQDWEATEPNNPTTSFCLAMKHTGAAGSWYTKICSTRFHYICEKNPTWPK